MSYGIKMWDDDGNVTYSSEDVTWNLLASVIANENISTTWTINTAGYLETLIVRQMIDEVRPDQESYIHSVSLVGNILNATAPSATYTQRTMITVFGK
jgi:hypothetical protein